MDSVEKTKEVIEEKQKPLESKLEASEKLVNMSKSSKWGLRLDFSQNRAYGSVHGSSY